MIRVLIVEDSEVVGVLLRAIIQSASDLEVVGRAKNGQEGVEMAQTLNPDLITMDIRMPVMDGLTAITKIMATRPKPIVVISSNVDDELQISFKAIDCGALAVLEKPKGFRDSDFEVIQANIVSTIRAMAEIKLVKRYPLMSHPKPKFEVSDPVAVYKLVAIGCSTGGPQALKQILSGLPKSFPLPIVVTQHISTGFVEGLASWLNDTTALQVKMAVANETLQAGTVYIAPDNYHCLISKVVDEYRIQLTQTAPTNGFRPSVTELFNSVAVACPQRSIGVILSGMGSDGAKGMLTMFENKCLTVAQDESSSVVFGMPAAAIELNAVSKVLPLETIAQFLVGQTRIGVKQ